MTEEMMVRKIKEGIVIDHIEVGKGIKIVEVLREKLEKRMVLLHNAPSKKMGKKDVVKIETSNFDEEDLKLVSLFSPNATLNWIKDWKVVRKEKIKLPEMVIRLLNCPNPKCITNDEREKLFVKSKFVLKGNSYRCAYCSAEIKVNNLEMHLNL